MDTLLAIDIVANLVLFLGIGLLWSRMRLLSKRADLLQTIAAHNVHFMNGTNQAITALAAEVGVRVKRDVA